jgi:hypothetical protein
MRGTIPNRGRDDPFVERREQPLFRSRQGQEIDVRQVGRVKQSIAHDEGLVHYADVVGPEDVARHGPVFPENIRDHRRGSGAIWIASTAEYSDDPVFRNGATRPRSRSFRQEPLGGDPMVYMVRIEERDEHVDVQQERLHGSSSRSRLTISSVTGTASGRLGIVGNGDDDPTTGGCSVRALRMSRDTTFPMDSPLAASERTAASTSSSMESVVLIWQI